MGGGGGLLHHPWIRHWWVSKHICGKRIKHNILCSLHNMYVTEWFALWVFKHFCGKRTKVYLRVFHFVRSAPDIWVRFVAYQWGTALHSGKGSPVSPGQCSCTPFCGCNGCCVWLWLWTGWSLSIFSWFGTIWLCSVLQHETKKSLSWWNRTPFVRFPGHSQNVSSFRSPELLIQCVFICRKETMQLVSGKVEFNACQVSLLWHNSFLVSLWTFQPTLVFWRKKIGREMHHISNITPSKARGIRFSIPWVRMKCHKPILKIIQINIPPQWSLQSFQKRVGKS